MFGFLFLFLVDTFRMVTNCLRLRHDMIIFIKFSQPWFILSISIWTNFNQTKFLKIVPIIKLKQMWCHWFSDMSSIINETIRNISINAVFISTFRYKECTTGFKCFRFFCPCWMRIYFCLNGVFKKKETL